MGGAIDNLKPLAAEALPQGYAVNFWTDMSILNDANKEALIESHVTLRHYQELEHAISGQIARFIGK